MVCPGRACVEALFVTVTLGWPTDGQVRLVVTMTLALLLWTGSVADDVTVAWFWTLICVQAAPGGAVSKTRVKARFSPEFRLKFMHLTMLPVSEQRLELSPALNVSPAGTMSETMTFCAVPGPAFDAVTV